jgi:hypothetical protein
MEINNERGGRLRWYCSDRCRKAANREIRRARAERDAGKRDVLLSRKELEISRMRRSWQLAGIGSDVERLLIEICEQHGVSAAAAAGDAVRAAIRAERESLSIARRCETPDTAALNREDPGIKEFLEECGL